MQNIYKEYADVRHELEVLETKRDYLKNEILRDLKRQKVDKVEGEYGKFTVCQKKNWIYSKKLSALEENLKIQKVEEQEKGIAKAEVTEYITYKPV